jgi:CBS-domain-containing membrane protein
MSRLQNLPVLSGSYQLVVIGYQYNNVQGNRFPLITNNRHPLTGTAKPEVLQVLHMWKD